MRTSSKTVTFTQPFTLKGLDGVQPAGTYTVETDEEPLPTLLVSAHRRIAMWIALPAETDAARSSQLVKIDPLELDAALARDAAHDCTDVKLDGPPDVNVMQLRGHDAGPARAGEPGFVRDLAGRLARMWRPRLRQSVECPLDSSNQIRP